MKIIGSPKGMVRNWKRFTRAGLIDLVLNWHKNTAKKHFKNKAFSEYNYERRSIKYQRRKDRMHRPPLVFSGRSRRELLRSIKVTATNKRAKGAFTTSSRYFWMTPEGHPNLGEELVRLTQDEIQAMAEKLNDTVTKKLNKVKDKRIVR